MNGSIDELQGKICTSWDCRHKEIAKGGIKDPVVSSAAICLCLCYSKVFGLLNSEIGSTYFNHRSLDTTDEVGNYNTKTVLRIKKY